MSSESLHPTQRVIATVLQESRDDGDFSEEDMRQDGLDLRTALLRGAIREPHKIAWVRDTIFRMAEEKMSSEDDINMLKWVKQMVTTLEHTTMMPTTLATAHFFPHRVSRSRARSGEGKWAICKQLDEAKHSVCICVFNLTDDDIAAAIRRAHDRGVEVRLITDDQTAAEEERGADAASLKAAGVPVVVDLREDAHMHHKFAIFDNAILLTGSFNWTWSASSRNNENIVFLSDQRLIRQFKAEFLRLWAEFGGSSGREEAASKIQACARGRMARKEYNTRKERSRSGRSKPKRR